jgi:ribosomal protein RSM22 (predicted rRNA methylase)
MFDSSLPPVVCRRALRIHKSKKERQHNGQKKRDKRTNIDLQNITHKTKDRVIRTPAKYRGHKMFILCEEELITKCN